MKRFRRFFPLAVITALSVGAGYGAMVAPPQYSLTAKLKVAYGKPVVELAWLDTITGTVIRTDIMRRDSTDTVWRRVGYTTAKHLAFEDARVVWNRDYHYRVRDSVSGSALAALSDSATIRVTAR